MSIARMIGLALAIEGLTVLVLVGLVAVAGPSDPGAAQAYAQELGTWVGPLAGFVLCLAGGWIVGRGGTARPVVRGLLLGAMVAAIDVALLVAGGAAPRAIFVLSNLGRLIAGALGGLLAGRHPGAAPRSS